jgi:uncharacterized membrane protein YccC
LRNLIAKPELRIVVRTSHALARKRLLRGYEVLCLVFIVFAAIILTLSDFAFAAIVVLGFAGTALVFAGMMDVLPEIVRND